MVSCPTCGTWTRVLQSRTRDDNTVYRRYECANEHRFSTKEVVTDKHTKEKKHERR